MDWNKEKFDWPHHNLSNFVISDPHTWHIQDTEKIYRNKYKSPVLLFIHGAGASTHSWRLILDYLKKHNLKMFDIAAPIRASITGKTFSPSIFLVLEKLGKKVSIERLKRNFD